MSCNIAPPSAATRSSRSTCRPLSPATQPRPQVEKERRRADKEAGPHSRRSRHRHHSSARGQPRHLARWQQARLRQQRHQPAPGKIRRRRNLRCRSQCGAGALARDCRRRMPALAQPRRITHNQAAEIRPRWANDSRHIFFTVEVGDVSGPYRDLQPHLYWVDTRHPERSSNGAKISSARSSTMPLPAIDVLTSARLGTEVQMYSAAKPADSLHRAQRMARHLREYLDRDALPTRRLRLLLARQARRNLSRRQRRQTRSGPPDHSRSTNSSPSAIFRKASPISGRPTTAPPSKAC